MGYKSFLACHERKPEAVPFDTGTRCFSAVLKRLADVPQDVQDLIRTASSLLWAGMCPPFQLILTL